MNRREPVNSARSAARLRRPFLARAVVWVVTCERSWFLCLRLDFLIVLITDPAYAPETSKPK
jgi:hypothetical protein